jgi:UDP-2-acetamido-3-amino-2,3-dideoxy-glucuronate N-acetyltransferase
MVLMMNRGIKTSIIGAGAWGKNVARELGAVSNLVGYVTAGSDRLGWLPRLSIDEILSDPTIKAVAVATPIALLAQFARLALGAQKHVFVEKPLARSAAEAQLLAQAAHMRHLILATGYQFVYHPVYTELKRRLDRESVRRVTLEWRKFGTFVDTIEHVLLILPTIWR